MKQIENHLHPTIVSSIQDRVQRIEAIFSSGSFDERPLRGDPDGSHAELFQRRNPGEQIDRAAWS